MMLLFIFTIKMSLITLSIIDPGKATLTDVGGCLHD